MTPAEVIMGILALVFIAIAAYAIEYFATRGHGGPLPPPFRWAIWGIAVLLAVLVLFWVFDLAGPLLIENGDLD